MKNIILIAPPAAGKGTQSKLICDKYNLAHISTGDILRERAKKDENLSKMLKSGNLIDDTIMAELVCDRLKQDDCKQGFILDGFPRSIKQAELLSSMNIIIDYVFYLNTNKETLIKRMNGRISCPQCGNVYNKEIEELRPKVDGYCNDCNIPLIKREDDNEVSFNSRYENYMSTTFPLVDYYKNKSVLYEINSDDKIETFNKICKVLNGDV